MSVLSFITVQYGTLRDLRTDGIKFDWPHHMAEPQHIAGYLERRVTDLMALFGFPSVAGPADESKILVSAVQFRP